MKPLISTVLLVLAGALPVFGLTADFYQNGTQVLCPPDPPPQVDATNFVNTGQFSITLSGLGQQYETYNTLNYTNIGTMYCNNGFDLETFRDIGGAQVASNFFNQGIINCGTTGSGLFFGFGTGVRMIVSAKNIVNPGNINMGVDSLLSLSGQNVDLTRSMLTMEGGGSFVNSTFGVTSRDYGIGTCPITNTLAWDPSVSLNATFAISSIFTNSAKLQEQVFLFNSTPYVDIQGAGTTNVIIRAVFLQNLVSNVSNRVFIEPNNVGGGFGHVEWAGQYIDPQTSLVTSNYFYLSDVFVNTTNSTIINGIPSGFTFAQSAGTPLFAGTPTAPGLLPGTFQAGNVTNNYSYVQVDVSPTTTSTNTIVGGSISNLPARIQLSASRSLNLTLAKISGANCILLQCTNQFEGNEGGLISVPYASINLGVTNGFMTASNLLVSTLPLWSGTIQAWNTRWFATDATGVTNYDFRVLLVDGELNPTASSSVENLTLHSTNSLIISDVFNVSRALSIDAQNLTLTTNGYGNGAASLDGELNLNSTTLSWATSVPRVRSLTNNGAIRIPNSAVVQSFGSAAPGGNYFSFINTSLVLVGGSKIWADNFLSTGAFYNTGASFTLQSTNTTIANGPLTAAGDIAITTGSLSVSNLALQATRSLFLTVTNRLTDNGVTNGSVWIVGSSNNAGGVGFVLAIKPTTGDLLGTTITNIVPAVPKQEFNTWAAQDRGASVTGYTNNAAVGRLILDSFGSQSQFVFSGTNGNKALYVDYLELQDWATNRNANGDFTQLNINSNLVIYYAQAVMNGASIAEKMDHKNNEHLRWVSAYAGYYSSTNLVYGGTTNSVNMALAQSTHIDSDGDGIVNAFDPTPFFLSSQVNLALTLTNNPAPAVVLTWNTIPSATNYVFFRTNLITSGWQLLTILPPSSSVTVSATDAINPTTPRYYQVRVDPQQP